jgi:hypothetical protein
VPFEPFSRPPAWSSVRHRIDALRAAALNFDPEAAGTHARAGDGWNRDAYETDLPAEPPGPPLAAGSWAAACAVLRDYEFPDPRLITGVFVPDDALEGRPMLLRARFLGFTFWFGVRVVDVVDEERGVTDGGEAERARVWGYSYRTLQGHWEQGQITFEVWKYLATGRVVFRVRAFSRPGTIPNPFFRLGFAVFGRGLQLRFARTALLRMRRLVAERLAVRAGAAPEPVEVPPVLPAGAEPEAAAELTRQAAPDRATDAARGGVSGGGVDGGGTARR